MSEIDLELRTSIPSDQLKKMKVQCSFNMSYEQFLSLEEHAKKTGGKMVVSIANTLRPQFEKIKQALEILK